MRTREVIIFVRRGDRVLAVHRTPEQGAYWHSIAGGVEEGEQVARQRRRVIRHWLGRREWDLGLDRGRRVHGRQHGQQWHDES